MSKKKNQVIKFEFNKADIAVMLSGSVHPIDDEMFSALSEFLQGGFTEQIWDVVKEAVHEFHAAKRVVIKKKQPSDFAS